VTDFGKQYRQVFATLGRSLHRKDGTSEREIRTAEKHLHLRVPAALRDYYRRRKGVGSGSGVFWDNATQKILTTPFLSFRRAGLAARERE
jgi:hypothetical protein